MKAVVYERYGPPDVLELREVDVPTVGDGEVLVRIHAAGVAAGDWHLLRATWFAVRLYQGLFRPKRPILGQDLAGRVEAIGTGVTRFRPGDEVFGSSENGGAFAEYASVPESELAPKPAGLTYAEAATVPVSSVTALQGLRDKGRIRPGHEVLINGASGGVGTYAVQIAKSFDAEVTAVCSTSKMDLVQSIGADHVIDYTRDDFTQMDERYDLVLDNVGNRSLAECRRTLRPEGIYVAVSGAPTRSLWVAMVGGAQMVSFISKVNREDLAFIKELVEAGKLRPVVDRHYALSEVPEALRDFGQGRARGKLVIDVRGAEEPGGTP
jgi:NADPH:quinone reductase-like Zn-dependent oxidoreductase